MLFAGLDRLLIGGAGWFGIDSNSETCEGIDHTFIALQLSGNLGYC